MKTFAVIARILGIAFTLGLCIYLLSRVQLF